MSTEESSPSDDEDKYLEESPCGRWHRRNTKLKDVPGIDALYQAMDMEEGVEVVWNEMAIPCVPLDDECLVKLNEKLMKLAKIEHPNLLKLYASWFDKPQNKMVFITEYYSAGSIRRFIQRRGNHPLNSKHVSTRVWKRWAKQILSALSCLHSPEVAITHGYVTCDTIFIQHDGYIKLGSVAPSMIQDHISSCSRTHRQRHRHYCAPEYGHTVSYTRSRTHPLPGEKADKVKQIQRPFTVDIYAFGIFCLEILSDLVNDSEQAGTQVISLDDVKAAIGTLDAEHQALILSCIDPDQTARPSANTLLSMSVFYEIPSLKVMCVHVLRQTFNHLDVRALQDKAREEQHYLVGEQEEVSATPQHLEIEKIDTEIKNGMHLLSDSVALRKLSPVKNKTPVEGEECSTSNVAQVREDEREHKGPSVESRLILCIKCQLNPSTVSGYLHLTLEFQMSDTMIRTLDTDIHEDENPEQLVDEIIGYGLLNKLDRDMVVDSLVECLT